MATLRYSAICSLDGYVSDSHGRFDWAAPDAEVHRFINEVEKSVGTYLYGRRMYDVMSGWAIHDPDRAPESQDYASVWQAAEKLVFSTSLAEVWTSRTRLLRRFEPAFVRALDGVASIGGATLAAEAFRAGLVDECALFVCPVSVGSGQSALPRDVRLELELLEERGFGNGMVYLNYRVRPRETLD